MFKGVGGCRIVSATVRRGAFISHSRRRPFCQYNGIEGGWGSGTFYFLTNQALPSLACDVVTDAALAARLKVNCLRSVHCEPSDTEQSAHSQAPKFAVVVVV